VFGQLDAETVFLDYLRVAPASGAVEFGYLTFIGFVKKSTFSSN